MDKIEFIARKLAVLDGVSPDAPAVLNGHVPLMTSRVRIVETVTRPAWHFYVEGAQNVMSAADEWERLQQEKHSPRQRGS